MVTEARVRERITIQLHVTVTQKQRRELEAFARYCIQRVERDLGTLEHWIVDISAASAGYTSYVVAYEQGREVEAHGSGYDGSLATWYAMCRLEQALREDRG